MRHFKLKFYSAFGGHILRARVKIKTPERFRGTAMVTDHIFTRDPTTRYEIEWPLKSSKRLTWQCESLLEVHALLHAIAQGHVTRGGKHDP